MAIIIPANTLASGGYAVDNSCRFNDGSSDYMTRAFGASQTSTAAFTVSVWVKRGALGTVQSIFAAYDGAAATGDDLEFIADDTLVYGGGGDNNVTDAKFRDVGAWYNIVLARDSGASGAANQVKIYVNGVLQTLSANGGCATSQFLRNGLNSRIGTNQSAAQNYVDMYMAEFVAIDGQMLEPTSFGEFDADSGIWKPIDVSGLTFGTNGFYLDFEDSGDLGDDESGNTNDFTETNLTAIDQTTDTPTNNFATFNSLVHYSTSAVFSEGNLKVVPQDNTSVNYTTSTIAMPQSGKWYAEFKKLQNDNRLAVGIIDTDLQTGIFQANSYLKDVVAGGIMYDSINGKISGNNGDIQTSLTAAGNNAIIGLAVDMDNQLFYVYVDGTLINTSGSGASFSYLTGTHAAFWVGDVATSGYDNCEANFGNAPYSISSGNADGNGYGNFEYAVPSGYLALCTKNLSEVNS